MRNCGGCTLCCYFCAVPEYNSIENEYCHNCDPAAGCRVYEQRKEVCRNFGCLWWMEPNIPESLRPDICGVMFEVPPGCKTYVAYVHPKMPGSFLNPAVMGLITKIRETNHPVMIHIHDKNINAVFGTAEMGVNEVREELTEYWKNRK